MNFSCFSSSLVFHAVKLVPVTLFFVEKYHKIKPAWKAGDENRTKVLVFGQKIEVVGHLRLLNVAEV